VFAEVLPKVRLRLLYDVSHNTCKIERHTIEGRSRELFVHRKGPHGAWVRDIRNCRLRFRALDNLSSSGETMGTESYVLVGTKQSEELSFSSAWHGAGRSMSRTQATERWQGRKLIDELAEKGVLIARDPIAAWRKRRPVRTRTSVPLLRPPNASVWRVGSRALFP